jgi:hypothetical protein
MATKHQQIKFAGMKIVRVIGGLGNQMFQYAFYMALKHNEPAETVRLDCSQFHGYSVHNGLEINRVFGIEINQASFIQLMKVTRPTYNYKSACWLRRHGFRRNTEYIEGVSGYYYDEVLRMKGNMYFEGYWQNSKYFDSFADEVRDAFRFKKPLEGNNLEVAHKEEINNSVGIHVRRGDFLNQAHLVGICELPYYEKAICEIKNKVQNPEFFIYSNDIKWCEENLLPLIGDCGHTFVEGNTGGNSYVDMQLMSLCRHLIIANSSFSWWGAYLNVNKDKIVIAPSEWSHPFGDIQMPEWTLI